MHDLPKMLSNTTAYSNYVGDTLVSDRTLPYGGVLPDELTVVNPPPYHNAALKLGIEPEVLHPMPDKTKPVTPSMRLVRVIIVDTDDRIPLEHRVLYNGDEHLTDADDQELFLGIPVLELLASHNSYRETVADKKSERKDATLDPIRVRDLTMSVVTLAEFA